jgi:aromatic-L-amino-acid decarboxylase
MTQEEFRAAADRAACWIASYMERIRDYPVLARVRSGEIAAQLPANGPEQGEDIGAVLDDFERIVVPGITHWNHPRFLAYFANSGTPPGMIAELLASALNVNAMVWRGSPAATELEQVTLRWLAQWLGLPPEWLGVIYDTASVSTLHALAAAREWADPRARSHGNPPGLTLYCSEQAHSSVEKAAIAIGIGQENVRKIAAGPQFQMNVEALEEALARDRQAGRRPFCIVATAGTTACAAIDPLAPIAALAERERIWLHVDAAYGGAFALLPQMRRLFEGWERADSVVVNPHKSLLTQVDLSVLYTRRPDILRRAFALVPDYLQTPAATINLMDYGVPLGRRFRALKLWFVMRCHGREGMAAILAGHVRLAQQFAMWVAEDERFELAIPAGFSLVCFRLRAPDEPNRALLDRLNESGVAFLSHTVLDGRFTLRLAVGNYQTNLDDLRAVWEKIRSLI